jgi:hypothetical protein
MSPIFGVDPRFRKCREQDSNLHTFRYQNLNLARLPIPPSRQGVLGLVYRMLEGYGKKIPEQVEISRAATMPLVRGTGFRAVLGG